MEGKKLNTPLEIHEIDFRIQSINKGGYALILAYKDARADMKRLDEIYGAEYWQKKYDIINGNLFCSVGVYNKEINQWIWKQDVGTESNTEKEKGRASDAFKRACFNLGIGRELYDYPLIQVKLNANEFKVEGSSVKQTYELRLKEWKWTSQFVEGNIVSLVAIDQNGKERFSYNVNAKAQPKKEDKLPAMDEKTFIAAKAHLVSGNSKPDAMDLILAKYSLTPDQYKALNTLIINAPEII